jgi:hypothetical protein
VIRCTPFLFFLFIHVWCYSQQQDRPLVADSSYTVFEEEQEEDQRRMLYGIADSTKVVSRSVDESALNNLKSDSDLQYKQPPTIAESLWDRLRLWVYQLIEGLFDTAVNTNWGKFFSYVIGVVIVVVVVMMILKVNAFQVFYSGHGAGTIPQNILHENIHEMDFDKLINGAVAERDYRKAVRLLFLHALKMLSDRHLIQWDQSKTNHDYMAELKAADLQKGFHELNYYFEYAWYGNFKINDEMFSKVRNTFADWKAKVK